jgi:protocatechuate 3,4-dioxygenase beta subunit
LWLLVALAVAAVGLLLAGDPLGLLGGGGRDDAGDEEADLLSGSGGDDARDAGAEAGGGPSLASLYGEGDLGGVRLRLLDAATGRPRAKQDVTLRSRTGAETVEASGADGVVLFGRVTPGKGWQVLIAGEGFKAVSFVGLSVKPSQTTDIGDVMLGQNVVLRGRVLDPSGRPVPKAAVAAYVPDRGSASQGLVAFMVGQALAVPAAAEEVASDGEGWFRFAALPEGSYSLVARHPGYGTRQQNEVVVSAKNSGAPLVVRLGEGAKMSGAVTDGEGRPVPGARVIALRDLGMRFSLNATLERDEAVTDAKGRYVLDTLVDGSSYRFGVSAEGFAQAWDQQPVEVQRALERDFSLSRGGWIEGRVAEEGSNTPIEGAAVTVVVGRFAMGGGGGRRGGQGGAATQPRGDPTTPAIARTDRDGRFKLGPVLPGPVMSAVIKAPGYTSYAASTFTGNAWADVALDQPGQVEVLLKRGGAVAGRVLTAEGQPIPGATVIAATSGNMGAIWVGSPAARSDAEGRYRIDGVPPGEYHLTADAEGFAQADAGAEATKVVVPEEGGERSLDVLLSAAAAITGVVTDGRGEPVAGARVRTRPELGNMMRGGGGPGAGARFVAALRTSADLTDEKGRYRLQGVGTSVEWTVEVEAEEYVIAQSEKLKLKAGEVKELDLVLTGGATLSGRVVGEGGRWVEGARVRVGTLSADDLERPFLSGWQADRQLDPRVFFSDAEGRFTVPNIRPGRILLRVESSGYVTSYKRNVTLAADQVLENHQVLLQRGELVEGVVKGADGRPLQGAMVAVTSQTQQGGSAAAEATGGGDSVEPSMNAQTDADGRFRIENVMPGDWNVVVGFAAGHAGWFGAQDEAAIKRGVRAPARDLEFRLKAQEPGSGFGGGGPRPPGTPRPPEPGRTPAPR